MNDFGIWKTSIVEEEEEEEEEKEEEDEEEEGGEAWRDRWKGEDRKVEGQVKGRPLTDLSKEQRM